MGLYGKQWAALTEQQIARIQKAIAQGVEREAIMERFGVNDSTISRLKRLAARA